MNYQELVDAIKRTDIKYNKLKPAMLAQCMLESGRCTTNLAKLYNNGAGMKMRPEMVGYAESVYYKTGSEPTGGADFCSFKDADAFVKGYWHFLSRSPYKGWESHTNSCEEFLAFVGKVWCPAGYTDSWKKAHGGFSYHEYILAKLFPEAVKLLGNNEPKANIKPVLLNAGHHGSAGAQGANKAIKEEYFTDLQSKEVKRLLDEAGIPCNIVNQDVVGGLSEVGKAARDCSIAIAFHYNAADGKEHGVEWLGGKNKPKSMAFAEKVCRLIATSFGYQYRGFCTRSVTVTSEFDKTNCPIAFLLESEFIDDETDLESFKKDVLVQSRIIAECIITELKG